MAIEAEWERRARERTNLVAALERSGGEAYGSGGAAQLLGVPSKRLPATLRQLTRPARRLADAAMALPRLTPRGRPRREVALATY